MVVAVVVVVVELWIFFLLLLVSNCDLVLFRFSGLWYHELLKVDKYFLATIVAHETKSRNLKNKPEGPFSHNKTFLTFE